VAGNPQIVVDFLADTSGLNKGMQEAGTATSGFGGKLKSLAKTGAIAAGAAGVGALIYTLKTGIGEWQESQKVTAQTEAVLKSTGQAAGVTAKQVTDLAGSIMKKTGIDDEAIQSGENLLLTFTNVRNEAGKGNDVFTQATRIMADMSTALGQDMTTSAIQLGKALNDPVKGMSALRRVGVSFTEAQQNQVKAMVAAGDTMGAQKLILRELTKEFGGSAEAIGKTLPGQLSILRESFNNFAGDLVGKLVPYLQIAINYLTRNWPQINAAIQQGFAQIKPTLQALGQVLAALGPVVVEVVGIIKDNWGTIGPIVASAIAPVTTTLKLLADALRLIAALLRGDWSQAWQIFKQVVVDAINVVVASVNRFLIPLRAILTVLWTGIRAAAQLAWQGIQSLITTVHAAIVAQVTAQWNAIRTFVLTAMTAVRTVVVTGWTAVQTATTTVLNAIKSAVTVAWAGIRAAVQTAQQALQATVTAGWNAIRSVVSAAANAASAVVRTLTSAFSAARSAVSALQSAAAPVAGVLNALRSAASAAASVLSGPLQSAASAARAALSGLSGIANSIAGAMGAAASAVRSLIDAIHAIPSHISLPSIPGGGLISKIPGLAMGGVVTRPTLALIGEAGPEVVLPLNRLAQFADGAGVSQVANLVNQAPVDVRVFIGDTELRGLVRTEVRGEQNRVAQTLLAGLS